ncbi:MAG: hypothetical protein GY765_02525 [bacterium]|nr:hypothetical protein [bacterium]
MTEKNDKTEKYQNKSGRIRAWSELLKSLNKFLWVIVIVIVLAALGKMFLFKKDTTYRKPVTIEKPILEEIDWSLVDKEVRQMMKAAREETETLAAGKLDRWISRNMDRVDNDFLDWYFSYWTQQKLGLKGLLAQVIHWVDDDNPTPAEKMTEEVQQEFSNRVLRPQIAQLQLERIINEIVSHYTGVLKGKLTSIPQKYKIKSAEWDRYVADLSVMVKNVEANRHVSLPMKVLVGTAAGGTLLMVNSLKPVITKIAGRISSRLAAKTAAKMAAKTGGKVAAKAGGKFLGTIIAVGIIVWDVWDHYDTKKKALPVLRQNIADYLLEIKHSLLHDPAYGIMTIIHQMEQSVTTSR